MATLGGTGVLGIDTAAVPTKAKLCANYGQATIPTGETNCAQCQMKSVEVTFPTSLCCIKCTLIASLKSL